MIILFERFVKILYFKLKETNYEENEWSWLTFIPTATSLIEKNGCNSLESFLQNEYCHHWTLAKFKILKKNSSKVTLSFTIKTFFLDWNFSIGKRLLSHFMGVYYVLLTISLLIKFLLKVKEISFHPVPSKELGNILFPWERHSVFNSIF